MRCAPRRLPPGLLSLLSLTAIAVFCLPFSPVRSQPLPAPAPNAAAPADALSQRLDDLLDVPALRGAFVGVLVRSLDDGRVLYERNADLRFVPASNQKILIAAAALARLGPEFRFHTDLLRTGRVDGRGTLRGDLFLRGGGDPSLTSEQLGDLARTLRAVGIRRITGRIRADDTRFDNQRLGFGWSWDDEPFDYQPQISALCCDENVVAVTVAPGPRPGAPATVTLSPRTDYAKITGMVTTIAAARGESSSEAARGGDRVVFDRARGRNEIQLSGTLAVGAPPITRGVTIEEPALYAATRLAELLRGAGVVVPEGAATLAKTPPEATLVGEIVSEPLANLTRHFLKASDNLYGEVLLKTLGAEAESEARGVGGPSGVGGAGERALRAFLQSASVDTSTLAIYDGSGLSRQNLLTPRSLVTLLSWLRRDAPTPVHDAFEAALPIGGVDGTLRHRFQNTPAAGAVRAKTGSLTGVSSLSGYVETREGEPLVFSILMNHFPGGSAGARAAQDAVILALRDAPRPSAPRPSAPPQAPEPARTGRSAPAP